MTIQWTNVTRKLKDLQPWAQNPRQINESQAERLEHSFRLFGQVETIAIGPDNQVYNGHQRLKVLTTEYGIGRKTRQKSKLGAIGYHPSLLPRHRGRDAVRWTIKMGDPVAGGSVYWLTENIDGGPIAAQDWCWVQPGDTARELWRRDLQKMGVRLIFQVLDDIKAGRLVMVDQDPAVSTWEPAMDSAPLFRPELPQLGALNGYEVVKSAPSRANEAWASAGYTV